MVWCGVNAGSGGELQQAAPLAHTPRPACFLAVSLPTTAFPDRLSLVVTVLLILVAYKLVVVERLPSISYLTDLDRYIYSCMVATVIIYFWNAS